MYRESEGKAENNMDVDSKEEIDPHNSVASTCEIGDSSANSEGDNAVTVGPVISNLGQTNLVHDSVSLYPLKWMATYRKYSERGCSTRWSKQNSNHGRAAQVGTKQKEKGAQKAAS